MLRRRIEIEKKRFFPSKESRSNLIAFARFSSPLSQLQMFNKMKMDTLPIHRYRSSHSKQKANVRFLLLLLCASKDKTNRFQRARVQSLIVRRRFSC